MESGGVIKWYYPESARGKEAVQVRANPARRNTAALLWASVISGLISAGNDEATSPDIEIKNILVRAFSISPVGRGACKNRQLAASESDRPESSLEFWAVDAGIILSSWKAHRSEGWKSQEKVIQCISLRAERKERKDGRFEGHAFANEVS